MFASLKTKLAVLAVASCARATITILPFTIIANSTNTISWTSSDIQNDPASFSIELVNPIFNTQFALANNVATATNSISFQLPVVPVADGYRVEFVDIGNINNIFSQSPQFSIAEHDASAPLPSSTPLTTPKTTSTLRPSGLTSVSLSTPGTVTQSIPLASPLSTPSATAPLPTSTAATTGSSSPSTPSAINAADALAPVGTLAAVVVAALMLTFQV